MAELAAWLVGRSKGATCAPRRERVRNRFPPGSTAVPWISDRALRRSPDFAAVRAEFALPTGFPPAVLADAAAAAARPTRPGPDRVDATDVALVTIDPPGSKDLDQAVGVVRRGDGFRVHYAIADLGAFVVARAADGRRGAPARADGLPARRLGAPAPAGALRGRREPAARRAARRPCSGGSTSTARANRWRWTCAGRWSRSRARLDYAGVQADVDAGRIHPAIAALPALGPLRRALAVRRGGDRRCRAARAGGGAGRRRGWTSSCARRGRGRGVERRDLAAHGHGRGPDHARRRGRPAAHDARGRARRRRGAAGGRARVGHRVARGDDARPS